MVIFVSLNTLIKKCFHEEEDFEISETRELKALSSP